MPLTVRMRLMVLDDPRLQDRSTCCWWLGDLMEKSISPVGIDVEMSQLLLDVRSKTNNLVKFKNASYILR